MQRIHLENAGIALFWPEHDLTEECHERYMASLSNEERQRHARFRFAKDATAFLAAHGLVRHMLSEAAEIAPRDWRFTTNSWGKLNLDRAIHSVDLQFNITHTTQLVAACVTEGVHCGIDTELISRCSRPAQLASYVMADSEVRWLETSADDREYQERFVVLWTLKEAYVKGLGRGLSEATKTFAFCTKGLLEGEPITLQTRATTDDGDWTFHLWRPDTQHFMAVALQATP